jgi:hypothetical protein
MVLEFGRAEPTTTAEQVFGLLAVVVMGCIYAYAIASICGILATMDPASTEFRNTKDLIKTWAAEVPRTTQSTSPPPAVRIAEKMKTPNHLD